MAQFGGFVWKFGTLGEGGRGWQRSDDATKRQGDEGEEEMHLILSCVRHHFVPSCLSRIISPSVRLARCCVFLITGAQRVFISAEIAGGCGWNFLDLGGGGRWGI